MSDAEPLVYSLDACDRIVRVNDAWTRFALENDAPELAAQHVLRRSIWDFSTTRRPVRFTRISSLAFARGGRPPFRCGATRHPSGAT